MNKSLLRFIGFLLVLTMLISTPIFAAVDEPTVSISQFDSKFPEDNPTSRTYAQSRRTFKAFEGRGTITIVNHEVDHATLTINGQQFPLEDFLSGESSTQTFPIGKYVVNGTNTIKVLDVQPEDSYLNVSIPYPILVNGTPQEVGMNIEKLNELDALINQEIAYGFPGAVLLIVKDGKIIKNTAYGSQRKWNEKDLRRTFQLMQEDTIFDLASNTKMYATNLALHKLVDEEKVALNAPVSTYIPGFIGQGRENITVKDLLTHSSGLDSSIRFYKPDNALGEKFYSMERKKTLTLLERAPLVYETGGKTKYSDTGFMLLGAIIESVTGQQLDTYVEEAIYQPLGLSNTVFNPLEKGFNKDQFAATERNGNTRDYSRDYPNIRKRTLQGEVHDEKAYYSMDGVSGHAGLFSTSADLAVLTQMILNGGGYGDYQLCSESIIEQFAKPSDQSTNYGLGWNRAADGGRIWQFSPYASNQAIGHTGWTGTLTVIDPAYDLSIILLTNKKHSPCPDGVFEGDTFQTGKYGSIVSLIYESFLENVTSLNRANHTIFPPAANPAA